MIVPVISVVGSKNSGKTTVAKELIAELAGRGLRVAAAKHSHHEFNFSEEGRDTTLFTDAGAQSVIFVGDKQTAVFRRFEEEEKLKVALARYAAEADVLVAEGWRKSALPKILVFLQEEVAAETEYPANVVAVVCPAKLPLDVPHFAPDKVKELADFLLAGVLAKPEKPAATVAVNGKYLPAKGFVQEFIAKTILGMISSLKGVEDVETVEVTVRTHGG